MPVDLSVEFCGVKFKNPFLLSPTPATRSHLWTKAARAGWAGAVTWTGEIHAEAVTQVGFSLPHGVKYIDTPPAFWSFQTQSAVQGLNHDDPCPLDRVERVVKKAKESGLPVIVNIIGGLNLDAWVRSCLAAQRAGADILEVNVSYALGPDVGMHLGFARDLDKTRQVIKAVREKIRIPIMVKLNAFLIPQEIRDWAKACVDSGANAISITNSIPGVAGIDVETGRPFSTVLGRSGKLVAHITTVDGPGIRPIGLAGVAAARSAVDIPIAAIGGVSDWHSAVEYMMVGASIVLVGSAVMAYGYRMVRDLTRGLQEFMVRKGYNRVQDFVGISNREYHLGERGWRDTVSKEQPYKIVVDELRCTGCGKCMLACEASADSALKIEERIAKIDQGLCQKCRMCLLVCPEEAISIQWDKSIPEQVMESQMGALLN